MHPMLRNKKKLVVNFGDDIKHINNYSRVKPEKIMKLNLKHYMQNGLSIYQSKHCSL